MPAPFPVIAKANWHVKVVEPRGKLVIENFSAPPRAVLGKPFGIDVTLHVHEDFVLKPATRLVYVEGPYKIDVRVLVKVGDEWKEVKKVSLDKGKAVLVELGDYLHPECNRWYIKFEITANTPGNYTIMIESGRLLT